MPGVPDSEGPAKRRNRESWTAVAIALGAIVALAALGGAVLGPLYTWGNAKNRQSRQGQCLVNVKKLGFACRLYAQDHDGLLPTATDPEEFKAQTIPYEPLPSFFVCPEARDEVGYVYNPMLPGRQTRTVYRPADTPMVWDAGARPGNVYPFPGTTTSRHLGGDNVTFADGHAKWFSADEISRLSTDPAGPLPPGEGRGAPRR